MVKLMNDSETWIRTRDPLTKSIERTSGIEKLMKRLGKSNTLSWLQQLQGKSCGGTVTLSQADSDKYMRVADSDSDSARGFDAERPPFSNTTIDMNKVTQFPKNTLSWIIHRAVLARTHYSSSHRYHDIYQKNRKKVITEYLSQLEHLPF